MTAEDLVFLALSCVSVVAAIFVVSPRNPIYAALSLLVMMLSLAGIFLQLSAPFLAVMQLVVYASAVIVLFIFVIMLMNLDPSEIGEEKGIWYKAFCFLLSLFLALFLGLALWKSREGLPDGFPDRAGEKSVTAVAGTDSLVATEHRTLPEGFGGADALGDVIFEPYLIPFELVSILIVIAVVGAVVMTKRKL
jgi:NADH-quinone oxidoreductase subunit J